MTLRLEVAPTTPEPATGARSLTDLRVAEALGHESAVLIADRGIQAVPMRMPPGAWGLLVTAAGRCAASGDVVLFAGEWCEHEYPASRCDGDLIVRLVQPAAPDAEDEAVAVRFALADHDRWMPAGTWPRLGRDWPTVVAPAAAAIMGSYVNAMEADPLVPQPMRVFGNRPLARGRVNLLDLLAAGLLHAGDELVYRRPGLGVQRTGQVTVQGLLRLDDGRLFTTPSAATTALGSPIRMDGTSGIARTMTALCRNSVATMGTPWTEVILSAEMPRMTPAAARRVSTPDAKRVVLATFRSPQWTAPVRQVPGLLRHRRRYCELRVRPSGGVVRHVAFHTAGEPAGPRPARARAAAARRRGGAGTIWPPPGAKSAPSCRQSAVSWPAAESTGASRWLTYTCRVPRPTTAPSATLSTSWPDSALTFAAGTRIATSASQV